MRGTVAKVAVACVMMAALFLTYNNCIKCVVCIALFAMVTMSCIPLMQLVFVLSVAVILLHSIDYNKATIKVEVPIQDVIYVPTWNDLQEYVSLVNTKL